MGDAQDFLAGYLVVGADAMKRRYVVSRLRARLEKTGDLSLNEDVFTGADATGDEIVGACGTMPFMSEYRFVYVREAEHLKKEASEALISYFDDPCASTVVLLESASLKKNTRLYKAVARLGAKAVIDCAARSKRDLPAQVRDFAVSHGVTIVPAAADELVSRVGEDTVHLDAELQKLAAVLGRGAEIGVGDVQRYVARTSEVKPWELADALGARDAARAMALLAKMPSASPFGLLTICVNRVRDLLVAKDFAGAPTAQLASALGKPDWQVRNLPGQASCFTLAELTDILISAAEQARQMKTGGDAQARFELWLGQACIPAAA